MDIARIEAILADSLGDVDEEQNALPGVEVVEVFNMPITFNIEKVHRHAEEMIELLKEWPDEAWGTPIPSLGYEINYIQAGAALGDQRLAFMLFGFGKLLNWWDILDPHTVLGMNNSDPLAQQMAGMGLISIKDYRPQVTPRHSQH